MHVNDFKEITVFDTIKDLEELSDSFKAIGSLKAGENLRISSIGNRLIFQPKESVIKKGKRQLLAIVSLRARLFDKSEMQKIDQLVHLVPMAIESVKVVNDSFAQSTNYDTKVYRAAFDALWNLRTSLESSFEGFDALSKTYEGRFYQSQPFDQMVESTTSWMEKRLVPEVEGALRSIRKVWEEKERMVVDFMVKKESTESSFISQEAFYELQLEEDGSDLLSLAMWIDDKAEEKIAATQSRLGAELKELGLKVEPMESYVREIYRGVDNNIVLEKVSPETSLLMPHQFLLDCTRITSLQINGKIVVDPDEKKSQNVSANQVVDALESCCKDGRSDEEGVRLCQHIGRLFCQTVPINQMFLAALLGSSSENHFLVSTGIKLYWKIDVTPNDVKLTISQGVSFMDIHGGKASDDVAVPFLCAQSVLEIPVEDLLEKDLWDELEIEATEKEKMLSQNSLEKVLPGLKVTNHFTYPLASEETVLKILPRL